MPTSGDAAFGTVLRELRVAAGLSQEALAERARLSSSAISTLERQVRRAPQRQTLALIAEGLGLGVEARARLERAANASRSRRPRVPPDPILRRSGNVPLALTSFHGREKEVALLATLIRERRIVTLFGPPGVGKTRLAIAAAHAAADEAHFRDGCWFAELAPLADPALVHTAVARGLGLDSLGAEPSSEALARAIRDKQAMLIVDNCEHLLDECARLIEHLAHCCEGLRIVATSREPLRTNGECTLRLETLPISAEDGASPAYRLFADRLADVDVTRYATLSDEEGVVVNEICRRLEGLPFALELAAARGRELSLTEILRGIDDRFALLDRGARTAAPRQRTLRATLDWSVALLTAVERSTFIALGGFAGTFSVEAVGAVSGVDSSTAADTCAQLSAKSLIDAVPVRNGPSRYRLLATIRSYVRDMCGAQERNGIARRHALYVAELALRSDALRGRDVIERAVAPLDNELDNVREALTWSLGERNDVALGATLASALFSLFTSLNLAAEGARWCQAALALRELPSPEIEARLNASLSYHAHYLGDTAAATRAAERAVALLQDSADIAERSWAQRQLSWCRMSAGDLAGARMAALDAIASARSIDDMARLGLALCALAIAIPPERAAERLQPLREAVTSLEAAGYMSSIPHARLGEAYFALGEYEAALAAGVRSVDAARKSSFPLVVASSLVNLAGYHLMLDHVDQAREAARETVELLRDGDNRATLKIAIEHLGSIAVRRGDGLRGSRLLGAADRMYRESSFPRQHTERVLLAATHARLAAQLDAPCVRRAMQAGAALTLDEAVAEALRVR